MTDNCANTRSKPEIDYKPPRQAGRQGICIFWWAVGGRWGRTGQADLWPGAAELEPLPGILHAGSVAGRVDGSTLKSS